MILHLPDEHTAALRRLLNGDQVQGSDGQLFEEILDGIARPAERQGKPVEIPNAKPWAVA